MSDIILSARVGDNSGLIPDIFRLYVKPGDSIADVTYGKGVFWQNIDKSLYHVLESDLINGVDFRHLPYIDESIDVLILDPPYMSNSAKPTFTSITPRYPPTSYAALKYPFFSF